MDKTILVIPAKGGSKNMRLLASQHLLDYTVRTALTSNFDMIVSTDDERIATYMKTWGVKHHMTSHEGPLQETVAQYGEGYENICLMQVTSPFIRREDIDAVVNALHEYPDASSAQTITEVRHNSHPWNQREVHEGHVNWLHPHSHDAQKRRKQNQPKAWKFGNVVAVRSRLLAEQGFFPYPSIAVPIHHFWAFDVDDMDDFELAEAMLAGGLVK